MTLSQVTATIFAWRICICAKVIIVSCIFGNNLISILAANHKELKNPNQKHALKLVSRSYLDILSLERYLALNFCIQVCLFFFCCFFCCFFTQLPVMSFEHKSMLSYFRSVSTLFSECQREESSWTHERAVCKYVVLWLWSVTQTLCD